MIHCVIASSLSHSHCHQTGVLRNDGTEIEHHVVQVIPHPYYSTHEPGYNLALVRVEQVRAPDKFVQWPICLAQASDRPGPNERCYVTGWGHTSEPASPGGPVPYNLQGMPTSYTGANQNGNVYYSSMKKCLVSNMIMMDSLRCHLQVNDIIRLKF